MSTDHFGTTVPSRTLKSFEPTWLGPAIFGLAVAACITFFWDGIASLLVAWQRPEYSHGYIIPFIALFIALKRLPERQEGVVKGRNLGVAIVVLALICGTFGRLSGIPDISTYGLLLAIAGLAIATWGLKPALKLWPAWVYLAFMLPLPNFIYWPLSIKLQFLSSEIGVWLIKAIGVPVFLDGNIIDLGSYQLQVAEACSGLRYLFPLMSFGFLFSVLYRGPIWHKILIFLASIPITILMNSVRIAVIGFLVNMYGIAQAEGFLHFFEGWVIFAVCIALLFLIANVLQRFARTPKPVTQVLDLDTDGLLAKTKRFATSWASGSVKASLAAILVAAVVVTTALSPKRVIPDRQTLDAFPMQIGSYRGERTYLEWDIERVLGADDYLLSEYSGGESELPVNLLISYYKTQNEGSGIHSPEVCIPGGGWEVSKWEQSEVRLKSNEVIPVNRAIIQKGHNRQLVYYWFEQRGRKLTNDYIAKAYTVYDSIRNGRSDGALIRVVTPMYPKETVDEAGVRLGGFLDLAMPSLPDFVPP
jgi:exosortase D (VPLPA-CTERM-specific)